MPYTDLRSFLDTLREHDLIASVTGQVDWNLELGHVAKINEERQGPALLFENIKDYPGSRLLTSLYTTKERVALALDLDPATRLLDISREWVNRLQRWGDRDSTIQVPTGPCKEQITLGDECNLLSLPVPWIYPGDGGRYVGTAAYLISIDPDSGRANLGTYRGMVIDKNRIGLQLIKGKDAEIDMRRYRERKQNMPVALVMGGPAVMFLVSSTMFPLSVSEYSGAAGLMGRPVEVVRGETVDVPIPATAEIVIEGYIPWDSLLPEGPFGEYTGYYSGKGTVDREYMVVTAITTRHNPIFWTTTVGKPVTDTHMVMGINRTAALWNDLQNMKIPGIKAVYSPPASAGRFLAIIQVGQMYPGHSPQIGLAAFASHTGNYGLKTVIVVDDDIDPENYDQVMYAMSFRYQPNRGTQILERGRSTPLDPSLEIAQRDLTSRIIIDTCMPWEWKDKPIPITLDAAMARQVKERWSELFAVPVAR